MHAVTAVATAPFARPPRLLTGERAPTTPRVAAGAEAVIDVEVLWEEFDGHDLPATIPLEGWGRDWPMRRAIAAYAARPAPAPRLDVVA